MRCMKRRQTVPAISRDRPLLNDAVPPDFLRRAYMLAIRRAARDAHRTACDRDAADCSTCCEHAAAIAEAKWALNHATPP